MEQHGQPVALAKSGIAIHEQQPILDLHLCCQVDALRILSGDPRGQHQIFDLELIDGYVEPGQDRAIFLARDKFGKARKARPTRCETVDVEPVVEPGARVPVHLRARDGHENPLRIGQRHIVQHRLAIDIALDPPDADDEAVGEGLLGDLAGEETFAQRRVQDYERGDHEQDRNADEHQRPLAEAARMIALAAARRLLHFDLRHQKACPSET